jgi:hypothetical protein
MTDDEALALLDNGREPTMTELVELAQWSIDCELDAHSRWSDKANDWKLKHTELILAVFAIAQIERQFVLIFADTHPSPVR